MKHIRACISFILLLSTLLGLLAVPAWAAAPAPTETTGETANTTEATETTETTSATEATQAPETTEAATEATEATEVTEATEPAPADDHEEDPVYLDDSRSKSMGYGTAGYTLESMERVPLYLQTDYPTVPYSGGSVATSGCTIACVSMVASYFMGIEILPDNLAKRFNKYDASNLQRMEAASIVLDIPYKKTMDLQEAIDALADGKVAIILLGKSSPFTASQHTVVLAGITKDGKVLVNDPYGPNHAKAELRDGFANGFPPEMLQKGFGGAWIYSEYAPSPKGQSRYPDVELSKEDKDMIAKIIWLEARGEPFEGQQAIAEIVLNRLVSDDYPNNIPGIILAEGQFRTTKFLDDAKPGELQYKAIEKALSGPNVLPEDVFFFARFATNDNIWGTIGHHIFCYAW